LVAVLELTGTVSGRNVARDIALILWSAPGFGSTRYESAGSG
jgi:hypothetical protein